MNFQKWFSVFRLYTVAACIAATLASHAQTAQPDGDKVPPAITNGSAPTLIDVGPHHRTFLLPPQEAPQLEGAQMPTARTNRPPRQRKVEVLGTGMNYFD